MLAAVDFVVVLVLVVVAEGLVVVGVLVEALVLVVDTEDLVVVVVRTDELVLVVVVVVEDFVVVWLDVDVGADEALLRDGVAAQVDTLSPLAKLESPAGCKA